jgi:hypothetical protein
LIGKGESGLIERIVENWLTSATERSFQAPFAQVLSGLGHKILHLSKHGVGEQGKDIITQGSDGLYYAYQLKSGSITTAKWYSIFGEIQHLIELPIQYPTGSPAGRHSPVLVTNGALSDDVRLAIQSLNEVNQRRGHPPLRVISLNELCSLFVQAHGDYLPNELEDLKSFLDLYNVDGRQNLDKSRLSQYFARLLDPSTLKGEADSLRRITSSVLLASYLLRNLEHSKNHVGLCEAWILLEAYIVWFAHEAKLKQDSIAQTLALLRQSVDEELIVLKDDVLARGGRFVEGTPVGDGGLMYSIRLTIVFGWLAARECVETLRNPGYAIDPRVVALLEEHISLMGIWGEYAVPFLAFISLCFHKASRSADAQLFLGSLLRTIVLLNNGRLRAGLPDPYSSPDELLSSFYSIPEKEIDLAEFAGSSYTLRALVDGLVLLNRRDLLEPMWKGITETRSVEYYPANPWDMLLWKSETGKERDCGYETPTSWASLRASLPSLIEIPTFISDNLDFASFMLLVYPHRFRRDSFCLLLRSISGEP